MNRLLIYIKKINAIVNNAIYKIKIYLGFIQVHKIVPLSFIGEKVCVFQNASLEALDFIKTYKFIHSGHCIVEFPEIALWRFKNSMAFYGSDFIVCENNQAIWPKFYKYNYAKNIVLDKFLVKEENGYLSIKEPKRIIYLDSVFSLIGVFSEIWAHSIVEYLPKLSTLESAISDSCSKITILIPEYKDEQLRTIITSIIKQYDVNVLVLKPGDVVKAKVLYYMERPTMFTDHETEITPGDQAIPISVIEAIRKYMVIPFVSKSQYNPRYKKIFLIRRGGLGKGIVNSEEIESYFEAQGFMLLEPHKVSLEEKINIFQSAEIIVGPFGSAFTNLFFCKPGTKVMIFSNFQRLFEHYFSTAQQYFGIDIMYVTGYDDKSCENMSHCSFYLPLNKVKAALKEFGITEDNE